MVSLSSHHSQFLSLIAQLTQMSQTMVSLSIIPNLLQKSIPIILGGTVREVIPLALQRPLLIVGLALLLGFVSVLQMVVSWMFWMVQLTIMVVLVFNVVAEWLAWRDAPPDERLARSVEAGRPSVEGIEYEERSGSKISERPERISRRWPGREK